MLHSRALVAAIAAALLLFVAAGFAGTFSDAGPAADGAAVEETANLAQSAPGDHGDHGGDHADPFAGVLLVLGIVVFAAALGQWGAQLLNQPAVLGELMIGVLVGNLFYVLGGPMATIIMYLSEAGLVFKELWTVGGTVPEAAAAVFPAEQMASGGAGQKLVAALTGPGGATNFIIGVSLWVFSQLGVIVLLFLVGLENEVDDMMKVGSKALLVALTGIVAPFTLGYGATVIMLPDAPNTVALFLGATLCATSVGITARVLKDMGKLDLTESKVILGAAVIDDVLGLVILAVVVGVVASGTLQLMAVVKILGLSLAFLGFLVLFGGRLLSVCTQKFRSVVPGTFKELFPLTLAFLLAWVANEIELATIVGAFAAGLVISEKHLGGEGRGSEKLDDLIKPLEQLFAPIFFVLMGMQVNLASFLEGSTLMLGIVFIVVAVIGKLVAGLAAGKGVDWMSVGIGMVPRGEVGLIFAGIGKGLGVLDGGTFSAVVIMVIATTFIAPLGLKWSLARVSPPA